MIHKQHVPDAGFLRMTDVAPPRKRAILIGSLYYPNVGGVENSLRAIAAELCSRGVEVDIVCSDLDQSSPTRLPALQRDSCSTIHRYAYARGPLGFIWNIASMAKLVTGLSKNKPAYSFVMARNHGGAIALRAAGIKSVVYVVPSISAHENKHRNSLRNPRGWLSYHVNAILQRAALFLAERTVVFSNNMRLQVSRFVGPKVVTEIVRPGIDQTRFNQLDKDGVQEAREKLSLPVDKKIILCLGRFTAVKGFEHAVRALALLPENTLLLIVGEGPCEELYLSEARRLGVQHRLVIRPRTFTPELYYKASSVFAFTSTQEAFGQVLLEATSCGLPVVAFKRSSEVETATEEIYEGFGRLVTLVAFGDPRDFSEAVIRCLSISSQEFAEFNRQAEEFRRRYSWAHMIDVLW